MGSKEEEIMEILKQSLKKQKSEKASEN